MKYEKDNATILGDLLMLKLKMLFLLAIVSIGSFASAKEFYVSVDGKADNLGTKQSPLTMQAAIDKASAEFKKASLPKEATIINVLGGHYYFEKTFVLGSEFAATADKPLIIRAVDGADVMFDGSKKLETKAFAKVTDPAERKRLASSAADKILVSTITDPALIAKFNEKLMLSLVYNGKEFLPSVYPNTGYAKLKSQTVTPEVCPPGIPVGKEAYGIRAGNPPHQEPGKSQGWKGSLSEPRGARAGISEREDEMAGTWQQWEDELKRNNKRNTLKGFIEANWLLSSQPIYAASGADKCVHLSQALAYGWAWKNNDKPFRVFGLLCEVDSPGEWYFDTITNRLYVYPTSPMTDSTVISLSVARGFMELQGSHISVIGISAQNVGSGSVYKLLGDHNLVASCKVQNSTATGLDVAGKFNGAKGCDLVDLNTHVSLHGGKRSPTEITPGNCYVENCHIYQKKYMHEKVNIALSGVGNRFSNNLVHNSIGQAMTINGNNHIVELNEFFNVGFEEGDGGAMYSGADLTGYGNLYRFNFIHHIIHCPGKVTRNGIHFDDLQAGSTCIGNIFYKSAENGIFYNAGAGHTAINNIFLEGNRGIYNVGSGSQKSYDRVEAAKDPSHMYHNTKENYVGRAEKVVGKDGWSKSPWREEFPLMNRVMSDDGQFGRMWPTYCRIKNNYYYANRTNRTVFSRVAEEAMKKNVVENDTPISPDDFVDYNKLNLAFKPNKASLPKIPFDRIGLQLDEYRNSMPDKTNYRMAVKDFFKDVTSYKGTTNQIDTAKVVEEGPIVTR